MASVKDSTTDQSPDKPKQLKQVDIKSFLVPGSACSTVTKAEVKDSSDQKLDVQAMVDTISAEKPKIEPKKVVIPKKVLTPEELAKKEQDLA
jgi:hypothetical protein